MSAYSEKNSFRPFKRLHYLAGSLCGMPLWLPLRLAIKAYHALAKLVYSIRGFGRLGALGRNSLCGTPLRLPLRNAVAAGSGETCVFNPWAWEVLRTLGRKTLCGTLRLPLRHVIAAPFAACHCGIPRSCETCVFNPWVCEVWGL